jgi:hypothetical protein
MTLSFRAAIFASLAVVLLLIDLSIGLSMWREGGWPQNMSMISEGSGFKVTTGPVSVNGTDLLIFLSLGMGHLYLAFLVWKAVRMCRNTNHKPPGC